MVNVRWLQIADPDEYVRRVLLEEAPSVPVTVLSARPWAQRLVDSGALSVDEVMVERQDADPVHQQRRNQFIAAILEGTSLPPLIAEGANLHLVDGYARLRAVRALGVLEVEALVQNRAGGGRQRRMAGSECDHRSGVW